MRELDWFDGPEEATDTTRRRPRWFPAVVAVPWLVVVALLVAPSLGRGAPGVPSADPPARAPADATTSVAPRPETDLPVGAATDGADVAPERGTVPGEAPSAEEQ